MLKIERPIVFFDTETTGTDVVNDRIVEISLVKFFNNEIVEEFTTLVNPGVKIPPGATKVHHITDDDVADSKTFRDIAVDILFFIKDCDLAGFNIISFDIPLLFNEFWRADIEWDYTSINFLDAFTIYRRNEKRDLSAAVRFYLNKEHDGAHGALADTKATLRIFVSQLIKYPDLPTSVKELALYSNNDKKILDLSGKFVLNENNEVLFNFGKNKGQYALSDPSYLNWMLNSNFAPDTKGVIRQLLNKNQEAFL